MPKPIMGVDVEIGSSPNSKRIATYTVFVDLVEPRSISGVTLKKLFELIEFFRPEFLVTDNFLELIGSIKRLNSFINRLGSTKLVQVTLKDNHQYPIIKLAQTYLGWKSGKPNSNETAKLCVELAKVGIGSIITGYNKKSLLVQPLENDQIQIVEEKALHPIQVSNPYLEKRNIIMNFGKGKDAIIYLSEYNGEYHVLKYYDPYSPSIGKLDRSYANVRNSNVTMAKREARILSLLPNSFNSPNYIERSGDIVVMTAIGDKIDDTFELAPPLSKLSKSKVKTDNYFHDSLDLLFELFNRFGVVHGGFSPFNILVRQEELYLIDFAQAHEINVKTFSDTPFKVRMDRALQILKRDLFSFSQYFGKKYRFQANLEEIYERFVQAIPQNLKKLCDDTLLTYNTQSW